MADFAERVLAWSALHGRRDLPWQATRDPYRVWLSEIMLQQTQVASVIPYYQKFLERFPTVEALAEASIEPVMQAWAGLGYYSRARHLHACAQLVMREHQGKFPPSAVLLRTLPGIGRSTAAAIAAFCFGESAAILDGNVKRVLARQFAIEGFPGSPAVERSMWTLAQSLLPQQGIESYTQAMMDLGATVCVRKRPRCAICPVSDTCLALQQMRTDELPVARPARTKPLRHALLVLIKDAAGAVLLERRPPIGIWGGLSSLPQFDTALSTDELTQQIAQRFGLRTGALEARGNIRHEFTHYSFLMHLRCTTLIDEPTAAHDGSGTWWLPPEEVTSAALPAPIRKLLLGLQSETLLL